MMTNVNNIFSKNKTEGFLTNGSGMGDNGIEEKLCHNKLYPSTKDSANQAIQSDENVVRSFRSKINQYGIEVWLDKNQKRPQPMISQNDLKKISNNGKQCTTHGKDAGPLHLSGNDKNKIADSQGVNKGEASILLQYDDAFIVKRGRNVNIKNELNGLLQEDINNIRDNSFTFGFDGDDKILINIKHGYYWWLHYATLEYKAKDWKTKKKELIQKMKAEIKNHNTDSTEGKYICDTAEMCSGYTGWVKWGNCSKPTGPDNNLVATVPLKYCNRTRTIKYTQLEGEQYLEIDRPLSYSNEGCTFSMWFKVDQDKIDPQDRKHWWKRLVNFGVPHQWYLKDELIIAIGGDDVHHTMDFYVQNGGKRSHVAYTIRQVMDGNWHHIIWVIQDGRWTFYHNGDKLWSSTTTWWGKPLMPKSTQSGTDSRQVVGAPAVFWDPYPQPCIGEFEIINRPITDNEAWIMYVKPV